MAPVRTKISPASARSHTRKSNRKSSSFFSPRMIKKIMVVGLMGILAWGYKAMCPPPSKICGTPDGPPITAPRIKLRDGRHLSYTEHGVPKSSAKYNVIFVHGSSTSKHDVIIPTPELVEEIGLSMVYFDRPGYGESDPHPGRTPKSLALDIEELADQLKLGSKFYLIGLSMGGQAVWGCLKYIPHRLAGAALVAPVFNYWWPNFPANLSKQVYNQQPRRDQWALWISHYTPWLAYWWNTQKWFPAHSVVSRNLAIFSRQDREILPKLLMRNQKLVVQQGEYEAFYRDVIVGYGTWEFDPIDLKNPFTNNEGSVHLWHGDDDQLVPVSPQRYIAEKLPWIHYHEISGAGHLFAYVDEVADSIIKTLLLGE